MCGCWITEKLAPTQSDILNKFEFPGDGWWFHTEYIVSPSFNRDKVESLLCLSPFGVCYLAGILGSG